MTLWNAYKATSGNADTLATGTEVPGTALLLNDNARQKLRALSALITVDAETTSFTWTAKWQVSNNNSTWVDMAHGSQNAAGVALATGTAGADAAVTKSIPAPDAIYGWRYARICLVTGGAVGNAVDTYAISYNVRAS